MWVCVGLLGDNLNNKIRADTFNERASLRLKMSFRGVSWPTYIIKHRTHAYNLIDIIKRERSRFKKHVSLKGF